MLFKSVISLLKDAPLPRMLNMRNRLKDTIDPVEMTSRIVITADRGGGKTTFIKRIISHLARTGAPHTGFFAEGAWCGNERMSFILHLVPEGETIPLCDRVTESWVPAGRFRYNPEALTKGSAAVKRARPGEIVIMDEIGLQELSHLVWAETLDHLLNKNMNPLIVAVRCRYLSQVMARWSLGDTNIFDGIKNNWDDMWPDMASLLSRIAR